jgi:DNA repair protein RadD
MLQLRDYQEQGVNDIRAAFQQGFRRVCYTAPCGAGKTILVVYMASATVLNGGRTIFLVHRVELLDQAAETFKRSGIHFGIIAPNRPISSDKIQLASVQTLARRLHKIPEPNLIITDEHHHSVASTWRKIFDYWPQAYGVGLTATPCRLNGEGLGEVSDILIPGPSAKDLIKQGYLAPYKYFAPPQIINMEGVRVKMGDYDQKQLAETIDKPTIIGDALEHYERLAKGKSAIVYCVNIEHSQHTAKAFRNAGYTAAHLDGKTHPIERKRITNDFRIGKLQIITNCDIVSEGYDCPGAEAVILLRPTQSLTLYVQQSMRCLRPDKNNPDKVGIIIDAVGNVARHGLPDEDREWSLEGKKKKPTEKREFPMKICPKCFYAHRPAPVCPGCGHVYKVEPKAEIEQRDGELAEVIELEKKRKHEEVRKARNVVTLEQIAMQRGYNPNWVVKQCELKRIPFGGHK